MMSGDARDLDPLVRENEALRQQVAALELVTRRHKATLQSIGDAVIATDAAGRITQMNPVAEALTGWRDAEACGRALHEVFQIVNEETRVTVESPVERVLREGTVVGLANHTVLIAKDKTERPIADSGAPIRNEKGETTGVVLVFRDQTEERGAQKALLESECKFRDTVAHLDEGYYSVTVDGLIIDHNLAFNRILGVDDAANLKGQASPNFWRNVDDRKKYVAELMTKGFITNYLADAKTIRGDAIVVLLHSHLVRDEKGQVVRIEGTVTDYTERNRTEDALRESEEKYRGLFDNAEVGMYRSRLDGSGIVALNQRLPDIFGFTKEELLKGPATMRWADPKARDEMVCVLRERGELRDHELDILTKGGAVRTVLASMKLYPGEGYLEGTAIDITERKAAERALAEARESLERRVAERTAEIELSKGLLDETGRLARVGGWELDIRRNALTWTDVTREIHEVAPDYQPTVETGINFYAPEAVPVISNAVQMAAGAGKPFDVELPLITATGRRIWVRAIGKAYFENGTVARIGGVFQDITDRKAAEEETRLSRQRLDLHVKHTPLAVIEFTLDGRIARWNPAAAEIFGFTEEEAVGQHWTFIVPEEVRGRLDGVWEGLVSQRGGSRSTNMNRHKSGRTLHCEWFNTALIAADGTSMGVASLVMDVTERKLAQEELAKHRDHLQELVHARTAELEVSEARLIEAQRVAHLGNWEWDIGPDVITGSEEFYRLFAVEPEQIARYPQFVECLHPDDRERVGAEVNEALRRNRTYDTDYRVRLRDGRWRDIHARGELFTDAAGKLVRLAGTCLDITERKQAEAEVRESERRYRTLAEALPHLVWTCLADGPWDYLSSRWVEYTGVPEADQLGYGWLQQLHPDDRERVIGEWSEVAPGGGALDIEFRIRRADGVHRWFKTRAIPFRDNAGRVVKWFGSNTDIDDSKRAEEEIRVLNAELEQRVAERTKQLEESNKELEAFSYSVSHDLRAPLRAIDGFARILTDDYGPKLDDEARRVCSIIHENTGKMGRLIDDLLTFSRLGRAEMQPSPIDMGGMARAVFHEVTTAEHRARIDFQLEAVPAVVGDPSLMRQVWTNLLGNAVKFSSRRERVVINVSGKTKDGENIFAVRDNGAGFDMRYVQKLFGVFQRLHTATEFEGTGVGLALVQRVIRRHGGRVWAEGETDRGATFYFALPQKGI